jgi:hypothetical protein
LTDSRVCPFAIKHLVSNRVLMYHKCWVPHPRRVFVFAPRVG